MTAPCSSAPPSDPARAGRLETYITRFMDVNEAPTVEKVGQDIAQGLAEARADFERLRNMSPAERAAFLEGNAAFLRQAGVSPVSPLASSLLNL